MDGKPSPWWVLRKGERTGPYSRLELKEMVGRGDIDGNDKLWTAGLTAPVRVADVHGLLSPEAQLAAGTLKGVGIVPVNSKSEASDKATLQVPGLPLPHTCPVSPGGWVWGMWGLLCSIMPGWLWWNNSAHIPDTSGYFYWLAFAIIFTLVGLIGLLDVLCYSLILEADGLRLLRMGKTIYLPRASLIRWGRYRRRVGRSRQTNLYVDAGDGTDSPQQYVLDYTGLNNLALTKWMQAAGLPREDKGF